MKSQTLPIFLAATFCLFAAGCVNRAYDPSSASAPSPTDKIQLLSMSVKPLRPIAPEPWRVSMRIKNVGQRPLSDISYTITVVTVNEEIGRGRIPSLAAGETIEVKSDLAHYDQGNYRVEGKVFLPKQQEEPAFADRQNNVMALTVVVAQ